MVYPADIEQAYNLWGANCGPCSLAAILNLPVNDVRKLMDGFERRGYSNITHIKNALDRAGVKYRSIGPRMPTHGLVFIQWGGHESKPAHVQYHHTHWIAYSRGTVFEVNAPYLTTFASWEEIMPEAVKEEGHGNGAYTIRAGIEILGEAVLPKRFERA
jgi:hypothetical protein